MNGFRLPLAEALTRYADTSNPARIVGVNVEGGAIRLNVVGSPWWQIPFGGDECVYQLTFAGVSETRLATADLYSRRDDDLLHGIRVSSRADEIWSYSGKSFSIYGSAPMPNSARVYAMIADLLQDCDAPRTAGDFLNGPSLSSFIAHASAASYLVGSMPESIRSIVVTEMERQNVPYSTIAHDRTEHGALVVRLNSSLIICNEATLEADV